MQQDKTITNDGTLWVNLHDGTYNLKKYDKITDPSEDFYAKHVGELAL